MTAQLNHIAQIWWMWMFSMFWQVSLLIILVTLLDMAIRRWAWPQVRYALWGLIFIKLIISPAWQMPTSVVSWIQPKVEKRISIQVEPGNLITATSQQTSVATTLQQEKVTPQPVTPKLNWKGFAFLFWLAGVIALSLMLFLKMLRLPKRHKAQTQGIVPEWFDDIFAKTSQRLKLRKIPIVVFSRDAKTPAVYGLLRPVLLLPVRGLDQFSKEQAEHLVMHELCHLKRGDLIVHWFCIILQIFYWFNPLLIWTRRQMRHVCEICCDLSVANILREKTPDYRNTLLESTYKLLTETIEPGLGLLGLFEEPFRIASRLEWLEKKTWKNHKRKIIAAVVAALVMGICVLPMAGRSQQSSQDKSLTIQLDSATVESIDKQTQYQYFSGEAEHVIINDNYMIYAINVRLNSGGMAITADNVKEFFQNKIEYEEKAQGGTAMHGPNSMTGLEANGNVKIEFKDAVLTSEKAVMDLGTKTVVLTGGPKINHGNDIVSGDAITVYLEKDKIIIDNIHHTITPDKGNITQTAVPSPSSVTVVSAVTADKDQFYIVGTAIENNVQKKQVLDSSISSDSIHVIVKVSFTPPVTGLNGFHIKTDNIRLIDSTGFEHQPLFKSFYEDDRGNQNNAWDMVSPVKTFSADSNPEIELLFTIPEDQLNDCKLRFFDKVVPVKIVNKIPIKSGDKEDTIPDNDAELLKAAEKGDIATIRAVLTNGAQVNAKDTNGQTALTVASRLGHADSVKFLLDKGADVNAKTNIGLTALFIASERGHTDVVKLLLDKGADVNAKTSNTGPTALIWASMYGRADVVKILLDNGADVNVKATIDNDQYTALNMAKKYGLTDIMQMLEKAGAKEDITRDIDIKLIEAAEKGDLEAVRAALTNGADINAKGVGRIIDISESWDDKDVTALIMASQNGHTAVVKLLLKKGADVNLKKLDTGSTALMMASDKGHTEIVKLLLDKEADVNAKIKQNGATSLFMASFQGHTDIVKLLIENGADVNAVTTDGNTALNIAKERKHKDIIKLLEKAGASGIIASNNLAQNILRSAALAQEAYWVDNETYTDSIKKLEDNYGLFIDEGLALQIFYADKDHYQMIAFHEQGNKKYQLNGPGGRIEEYTK